RLKAVKVPSVKALNKTQLPIRLDAKTDCPRYLGRVIEGVNPLAKTPDWILEHLRRSGLRGVSAVVDVTNFVMLELGQPMHAFDFDTLEKGIIVRQSKKGEQLKLLDGSEIELVSGSLVIADHKRPVALAGIMGGEDTAIGDSTKNILLESAFFRPNAIAGRARGYGLHTDSSHRFERGVDPTFQKQAMERATGLLLKIVGGQPGPVVEVVSKKDLPNTKSIKFRYQQIERVLGIKIPKQKVQTILDRLGMGVRSNRQGWTVSPPTYRFDVEKEHDLIEEVGRVYGYDDIPDRSPKVTAATEIRSEQKIEEARLRAGLIDRDYYEVITYSFVDDKLQSLFHPGLSSVKLINPIAANMSSMRLSLWPGLIQALINNFNRQHRRIRLFEMGHNFQPSRVGSTETQKLAGVITGEALAKQWAVDSREVDFFDIKGDLEALLTLTGRREQFKFRVAEHPALHPGQTAEIVCDKENVGIFGQLHPDLQAQLDIEQSVYLFELSLNTLLSGRIPAYKPFSKYPATRRDLSVLVDRKIPAQKILDVVSKVGGKSLVKLELFDEYRGETIDSLRKSLAFGLTLQATSRTLKEGEVEQILARILETLKSQFGAELRN
ncbi:phenylalanine--tRNA ligase subunit beta, partial [Pseudomonadota bacterium]